MNVTSKMYLNELVKGFKNEGPTFLLFMVSYFYFAERCKGPFYLRWLFCFVLLLGFI